MRDDLELATLNWVWWFNEIRLHGEIGHVPPIEFESAHYRQINAQPHPPSGEPSLHETWGGSRAGASALNKFDYVAQFARWSHRWSSASCSASRCRTATASTIGSTICSTATNTPPARANARWPLD